MRKFRIFLTFPLVIWIFLKCFLYCRDKKKDGIGNDEEKFYNWTKKYASFILWLYGYQLKIKKKKIWNEHNLIFIISKPSFLFPLILIKINDFQKHTPLSILISEEKMTQIPKFLLKFYSLINFFIFDKKNKEKIIKETIKNIQIPRSLIFFFDFFTHTNKTDFINIITGSFVDVILCKEKQKKNKIIVTFLKKITSKNIIALDKKFITKRWNKIINE